MALFLDSSALVKRYVIEVGTPTVEAILTRPEFRGGLFVAEHIEVEVVSALAKKVREGRLERSDFAAAVLNFRSDYPAIFNVVPIGDLMWDAAQQIVRTPDLGIRGFDALHLVAARHVVLNALPSADPLVFVTADLRLRAVALYRGMLVFNPETEPLSSHRIRSCVRGATSAGLRRGGGTPAAGGRHRDRPPSRMNLRNCFWSLRSASGSTWGRGVGDAVSMANFSDLTGADPRSSENPAARCRVHWRAAAAHDRYRANRVPLDASAPYIVTL